MCCRSVFGQYLLTSFSFSAVLSVPTLTADFWAEVADRMDGSFSPSDCQAVYHQLSEDKVKRTEPKKQTKGKGKANSMDGRCIAVEYHMLLFSLLQAAARL